MFDILLVEDDNKIREVIREYIGNRDELDIKLHEAWNGDTADIKISECEYDLVLLDIMLPGTDGFTLCKKLRKNSDVPIIFITAKGLEEDKIHGYDLGCDDYIVKPFSLAELYVKIRALLNRSKGTIMNRRMQVGNIELDTRCMQVYLFNNELEMPQKEYLILKILMENKNAVVSRESMIVRIWGYDFEGDERILDNHIKKLRKLLGDESKRIKTAVGKGYKITE